MKEPARALPYERAPVRSLLRPAIVPVIFFGVPHFVVYRGRLLERYVGVQATES